MIDIGKDLHKAFDDGEWSMFERISSAYYGKQCYFLEPDGTVYSRLYGKTLDSKEDSYKEFINEMEIKPCKDCLYYDDCMKELVEYWDDYPHIPVNLKNRIYKIFIDGWDCFHRINRDCE